MAKAQFDQSLHCTNNKDPEGPLLNFTSIAVLGPCLLVVVVPVARAGDGPR